MKQKVYRLEDTAIDVYFQKSSKFLYPLILGKRNDSGIEPIQTYLAWKGHYKTADNRLICLFSLSDDVAFRQFEKNLLLHELFEGFKNLEDSSGAYIFNLNQYAADMMHFRNGRYSLLSAASKEKILSYYKANKYSAEYMDSFLNPEQYFEKYATLFNVEEGFLRNTGELCDPFSMVKETLCLKEVDAARNMEELLQF